MLFRPKGHEFEIITYVSFFLHVIASIIATAKMAKTPKVKKRGIVISSKNHCVPAHTDYDKQKSLSTPAPLAGVALHHRRTSLSSPQQQKKQTTNPGSIRPKTSAFRRERRPNNSHASRNCASSEVWRMRKGI